MGTITIRPLFTALRALASGRRRQPEEFPAIGDCARVSSPHLPRPARSTTIRGLPPSRLDVNPMNSLEYRQWRQRRRAAGIDDKLKRKHPDVEAARIIEFASMWAPYGGAPDEEILVHFGMTTHRFIERLWEVVPESKCIREEICGLANAYAHPRRSGSSPVP